ncbi:MAG: aspartate aminotransferase family protein [Planctomycetaceae bacterium]|nr:aspartate aminotransferase family protein [Planctomycetaceae bacterium]
MIPHTEFSPIEFSGEQRSNSVRLTIARQEPVALRTFTPSQMVLARSSGVFHWTPEGRRLYDYSSGVLVANLGHNPVRWMQRFARYMGWPPSLQAATPPESSHESAPGKGTKLAGDEFFSAVTMTAYNAITPIEAEAVKRLVKNVQSWPGGKRLDTVMWAASGSEAVQKALWACLHRDTSRDMILATRHGFHGKKGLAGAVTGSESDHDRDMRVKFIGFPMDEVDDASRLQQPLDLTAYRNELDGLWNQFGRRLNCLITEPYLGGGGSYHPPAAYHQLLEAFCREHLILFILDEVQANFGRTGRMFAFEAYGIEPDFVVLGKGLGNGVPVSAVVGRGDVMSALKYGEASDTWSANPLGCAAVLATLDEFEATDVLEHTRQLTPLFLAGLNRLKETSLVAKVRGEGLVFGIECADCGELTSQQVAIEIVRAAYLGNDEGEGIHLLGPLAGNVIRISPPLVMTFDQARASLGLLAEVVSQLAERLRGAAVAS